MDRHRSTETIADEWRALEREIITVAGRRRTVLEGRFRQLREEYYAVVNAKAQFLTAAVR